MKGNIQANEPEAAWYTKYYEHDGMLRAYANRSMVLAMVFGALALISLAFAIYVRLQPPTVIRVDKDGNATVVGAAAHPRGSQAFRLGCQRRRRPKPLPRTSKAERPSDASSITTCLTRPIPWTGTCPSHST